MKKLFIFSALGLLLIISDKSFAQEIRKLSFDEVIKIAEEQSPNALMAKHRYRASYWQYRTFKAEYMPSLTLIGTTPNYSTAYDRVWNSSTQQYEYKSTNIMRNIGTLALTQNIGFTGGTISVNSDLTLENDFENNTHNYITAPVSIGFTQPLFRYIH